MITFKVVNSSQTLRLRLRGITDAAQNYSQDDNTNLISKMDELERLLFFCGQSSLRDYDLWLSRRAHILTTASMVKSHNKRKFSEISQN